jgi:hypothetical protein
MDKKEQLYNAFIAAVDERNHPLIHTIHAFLIQSGCRVEIKPAARENTYVVSYKYQGKVVFSYIFRKAGVLARLYAVNVQDYEIFLETLPEEMKKAIDKASNCKRLLDPTACSPKCSMGYDFHLDDKHYQKCRYNAFQFPLNEENNPFIQSFLEKELAALTQG